MNDKKQIKLHLTFERDGEDGKETESFPVLGEMNFEGTKTHISYSRKDGDMTEKVTVTVHTDGRAEIDREGAGYKSRLFIRQGKTVPANYLTPYGVMDLSTKGNFVSFDYDGETGILKLSYDLLFSGKFYSVNNVTVKIEEQSNKGEI